jgi:acetylornithine deacetylase/succinyl-diaminopimelate desuccinylase-like protein
MKAAPQEVIAHAKEILAELVALPSVAAEGRALQETAAKVAELLEGLGLKAEVHPTPGAPVVFAQKSAKGPTLLFYNHYDVQPADPLELWESNPFTLSEREGRLYGRGASDDKGELAARIAALSWLRQERGELPAIKFVVEGEEEIGSPHLADYVASHRELLAADAVLWEAGGRDSRERPILYTGLKGIVAVELRVRTAAYDLHSSNGAVVENPIYRLSQALTSLRDESGRVLIAGFYDRVRPLTPLENQTLWQIPDESEELARLYGVSSFLGGVRGTEFYRKLLAEPCVNFNGFHAGYGGPGSKTVLPAEAMAKLDFRLVPEQDPAEIVELLKRHLKEKGFSDIEVHPLEVGEHPARSDLAHPWVEASREALQEVYGVAPVVYPNMAGSGPMYPFLKHLGASIAGFGIGYPGSRVHSPNEHIRLSDLGPGIAAIRRAVERYLR